MASVLAPGYNFLISFRGFFPNVFIYSKAVLSVTNETSYVEGDPITSNILFNWSSLLLENLLVILSGIWEGDRG